MEARPPPQALADPGSPAARREERAGPCEPLAAAAALGEDRWGEGQRSVRLSARPQPRRGGSPSSPPCAPEEDGGGNGAVEEKENGKKKKLGALATTWLIFYNVAMTAGTKHFITSRAIFIMRTVLLWLSVGDLSAL
uniref:Uncharacterized protein n=1 Tax=Corvus moneduloides TaxID=1196302 RepID=A0A8U7MVW4_CORMO